MEAWWNNLVGACKDYSLEPVQGPDNVIYIIGSKIPAEDVRNSLSKIIPLAQRYEFLRGMKKSTVGLVTRFLMSQGFSRCMIGANHDGLLVITIPGIPSVVPDFVTRSMENYIFKLIKGDGFITEVRINVVDPYEGVMIKPERSSDFIKIKPSVEGEGKNITKDDILNLKINLNQFNTVEKFLENI